MALSSSIAQTRTILIMAFEGVQPIWGKAWWKACRVFLFVFSISRLSDMNKM